jgi:antitoxin component YwqK of YwqJK toxin-antitoxin module
MRYIPLFLVLVFLAACSEKLEERVTETFDDGKTKRVQYFKGEGEDRYMKKDLFYYENGNKRVEGEYNKEGQKDGKWTYWYEDGKKWSEGYFSEGLNHKKRTTWHENGEMHYTGTYDKGKRVGVWKFYSEEGELVKEIDYDNL